MYCWGCGHAIVLGPGGECVECAVQHPLARPPAADVAGGGGRTPLAVGIAAGTALALAGTCALGLAVANVLSEVLR